MFDAFEIILQFRVGVRKRIGELINIVFAIETKCKGHDVVLPMFGTSIIKDIARWQTLPRREDGRTDVENARFTIVDD